MSKELAAVPSEGTLFLLVFESPKGCRYLAVHSKCAKDAIDLAKTYDPNVLTNSVKVFRNCKPLDKKVITI